MEQNILHLFYNTTYIS